MSAITRSPTDATPAAPAASVASAAPVPSFRHIRVEPLTGVLGANIRGLDLGQPLTPALKQEILAAFEARARGGAAGAAEAVGVPAATQRRSGRATGPTPSVSVPSLHRVEWEHIQRVLADCGGNISEAARQLGMHRRTLQRKLATRPPGH